MTTHNILFELRNVQKVFENGTHALQGIDLDVRRGEFLAVIGLSGSGKSTLIRCMNQLYSHTSGSIKFEGREVRPGMSRRELRGLRKEVAMIFQQFNLIRRESVLTNVLSGCLGSSPTLRALFRLFSDSDIERAKGALRLVELQHKARVRADSLSGGQQQRVAIARALMQSPKVILADEPVASLDPSLSHSVMDYLKKINEELGTTIVCNLHFLSLVRQYAHRVVALLNGKIVFEGKPQDITDSRFKQIYGQEAREVEVR